MRKLPFVLATVLATLTLAATAVAARVWPAAGEAAVEHAHHDLTAGHEHLEDAVYDAGCWRHTHPYRIDDIHTHWPSGVRRLTR